MGEIVTVDGHIVDVAFGIDDTPTPLEALHTGLPEAPVRLEVVEARAAGLVRTLAMDDTLGLRLGLPVVRTGGPLRVPADVAMLGRLWSPAGEPLDGGPPVSGTTAPLHVVGSGASLTLLPDLQPLPTDHPGLAACPLGRGRTASVHAPPGTATLDSTDLGALAVSLAAPDRVVVIAAVSFTLTRLASLWAALQGHGGITVVASGASAPPLTRARTVHAALAAAAGLRQAVSDVVVVVADPGASALAEAEVHVLCATRSGRRQGGWDLPDTRPGPGSGALTVVEIHPPAPALPEPSDDPLLGRLRAIAMAAAPPLPHADFRIVLAADGVGEPPVDVSRSTSLLAG